jgi:hypothetical protein
MEVQMLLQHCTCAAMWHLMRTPCHLVGMQVHMFLPHCTCTVMRHFNACTDVILEGWRCRCFFSTVRVLPCDISTYALMSSSSDGAADVTSVRYVCCHATFQCMHWCHLVGMQVQVIFHIIRVLPCDISSHSLMSSCRDAGANVSSTLYMCCYTTFNRMHWYHLVGMEVQMFHQHCTCGAMRHLNACSDVLL